jgi:hypothetical protein
MLANPLVGLSYRQEYYKGEAEDMAQVVSLNETASVSYNSFTDLVMTYEWTPLSSTAENKYYAPGIGVVLEEMVHGGTERVELKEIRHW